MYNFFHSLLVQSKDTYTTGFYDSMQKCKKCLLDHEMERWLCTGERREF